MTLREIPSFLFYFISVEFSIYIYRHIQNNILQTVRFNTHHRHHHHHRNNEEEKQMGGIAKKIIIDKAIYLELEKTCNKTLKCFFHPSVQKKYHHQHSTAPKNLFENERKISWSRFNGMKTCRIYFVYFHGLCRRHHHHHNFFPLFNHQKPA